MADSQQDVRNPLLNGEDGGGAEGRRQAEGEEEELDLERSNETHNAAIQLERDPIWNKFRNSIVKHTFIPLYTRAVFFLHNEHYQNLVSFT